ncbi:MAG: hypothetical protein KC503_15260 [Myxococcales bacterium]|nr:hypothetical protein [Myxococcales bacterium]
MRVLFSSDLFGRFAWPGCKRAAAPRDRAELGHLAAAIADRKARAVRAGELEPVVVHAAASHVSTPSEHT